MHSEQSLTLAFLLTCPLTLQQGSIISSLATMSATQPSTTLFRYTIGVLPMSCRGSSPGGWRDL